MCVGRVQTRLKLTDGQLALHHHRRYRDAVFLELQVSRSRWV
jgi:hypothetical protein